MDTIMPILMTILAVLFIGYLTKDTFESVKSVMSCDWAPIEYKQVADTFWRMWLVSLVVGGLIVFGVIKPNEWFTWL